MSANHRRRPDTLRRATALATWTAALGWAPWLGARAQATTPVTRILTASPPGGTPDTIARHYAAAIGQVVVENRPGAAGFLAVSALMQAEPDGRTLLLVNGGLITQYPFLYPKLPYDPATDLVPVCFAAEITIGFAVGPLVPGSVRTLNDFARWAHETGSAINFGTPANGSVLHILGVMLAADAGFQAMHVPYIGGPQAITDLLGGRLAAVVLPDGFLRPLHDAGKLRVLGTSGALRNGLLPAVPTLKESGYPRLVVSDWYGFFMPRGSGPATTAAAAQAVQAAAAKPALVAALGEAGAPVLTGTAGPMLERIAQERQYWGAAIAATGIRLQ